MKPAKSKVRTRQFAHTNEKSQMSIGPKAISLIGLYLEEKVRQTIKSQVWNHIIDTTTTTKRNP